jgi:hypothetical protein
MIDYSKIKVPIACIAIGLVVGAIMALALESSCRNQVVTHQETVANEHAAAADAHQGTAGALDTQAANLAVPLSMAQAAARVANAKVARLEQALADAVDHQGPVPPETPVDAAKDALIVGLRDYGKRKDEELLTQSKVLEMTVAARDEWRATAMERQKEAGALRLALGASKSMQKNWAAGATYERTQEGREGYGLFVDRDILRVVRAGVEVASTRIPGARADIGIKLRIGMRF